MNSPNTLSTTLYRTTIPKLSGRVVTTPTPSDDDMNAGTYAPGIETTTGTGGIATGIGGVATRCGMKLGGEATEIGGVATCCTAEADGNTIGELID